MRKPAIVASVLFLACSSNVGVCAADMKGRVEKDGKLPKRIARPEQAITDTARLPAQVHQTGGSLSAGILDLNASLTRRDGPLKTEITNDSWNPWTGLTRSRQSYFPAQANATAANAPLQTAVDYNAIESAYANAIPPLPAKLSEGAVDGNTTIPSGAFYGPAVSARLPYANGGLRQISPMSTIDTCACDTVVPTSACMQSRQVGLYSNGTQNATTLNTRPSLGNVLNGTAVPGGVTSTVPSRASTNFHIGGRGR